MLPYSLNSTLHPRLGTAVASHRFSFCLAPPSSSPNLSARALPQSLRPGLIGKTPALSELGWGELCAKSGLTLRYLRNSFALYPFADPHPLNPAVSTFYKNVGGGALSAPNLPSRFNSFSCNIYGPCPVNVANKKTYAPAKFFRCNTYKKGGVGVSVMGVGGSVTIDQTPPAQPVSTSVKTRNSQATIVRTGTLGFSYLREHSCAAC